MSIIYAINPTSDTNSVRSVLDAVRRLPDTVRSTSVILRIPDRGSDIAMMSDIDVKPVATRKAYDEFDDSESIGPRSEKIETQEAIVELLKSLTDIDVMLPMGYIVFEVPLGASDTETVDTNCFLTLNDLHHYLVSIGATPEPRGDVEANWTRWKGFEITNESYKVSSLAFRSSHHCIELSQKDAVEYLSSLVTSKPIKPKFTAETGRMKSRIYVVQAPPCPISIIKDSALFTGPVSKQRLLYLYDSIHEWLEKFKKKWISFRFRTRIGASAIGETTDQDSQLFRYHYDTMVKGWNDLPKLTITPMEMTKDLSLSETPLWQPFSHSVSLESKLNAIIEFLESYGIDMSLDSFSGVVEDYVTDRKDFQLPIREVVTTVTAVAIPRSLQHSRSQQRSYSQQRDSRRDRSSSPATYRGRGRGFGRGHSEGRGLPESRGRGRAVFSRGEGQSENRGRGRASNEPRALPLRNEPRVSPLRNVYMPTLGESGATLSAPRPRSKANDL